MTLATSQPSVSITLIAPQAIASRGDPFAATNGSGSLRQEAKPTAIPLYPGEFASLAVEFFHTCDRPMHLSFELRIPHPFPANCFQGWHREENPYRVVSTEDSAIAAPGYLFQGWYQESNASQIDAPIETTPPHQLDLFGIPPQSTEQRWLHFFIPIDYFETLATSNGSVALQRSYSLQLAMYATIPDTNVQHQLVYLNNFALHLHPRSLYLNLLPAVYHSVDFLERFLKVMEEAFHPVLQTDNLLWAYLNPLTAPKAMLPFLASWIGCNLDPRLSEWQTRLLIRHGVELYRWRGTRRGLHFLLHLATGIPWEDIDIQEAPDRDFSLGNTTLGETAMLGGGQSYHFNVTLHSGLETVDESLVRSLVEEYKPAFCTYSLLQGTS